MAFVTIFLTNATEWVVPPGVGLVEQVTCLGRGGKGSAFDVAENTPGSGGGGGGFARKLNIVVTPGETIPLFVHPSSGNFTWFKDQALVRAASGGDAQNSSNPGPRGSAGLCNGDLVFSGSDGSEGFDTFGGAGGGAGGPHGQAIVAAGDNGHTPTPALNHPGNNGTQFGGGYGVGSGGGRTGAGALNGMNGGQYGGGASGSRGSTNTAIGGGGLIVITYSTTRHIFLSNATQFVVPSDWGPFNAIHCIGAGGKGGSGAHNVTPDEENPFWFGAGKAGAPGGGGAFALKRFLAGLVPGQVVDVQVGPLGDTWFLSPETVLAKAGQDATDATPTTDSVGGDGGSADDSVGDIVFRGGHGWASPSNPTDDLAWYASGGGGAAGPDHEGGDGSSERGGNANSAGATGHAGPGNTVGIWPRLGGPCGPGEGGSGQSGPDTEADVLFAGSSGGNYGGGASGAGANADNTATPGGGLIYITYEVPAPTTAQGHARETTSSTVAGEGTLETLASGSIVEPPDEMLGLVSFSGEGGGHARETTTDRASGRASIPPPRGEGAILLYRHATGLEKAMADISADGVISINAELIIDNWDPYRVQERNIPFLAYGLGVNVWESDYWSIGTKREWLDRQWLFKSLRGTIGGIRMALDISGYSLPRYVAPPQGFYASPEFTTEEWNTWIRRMPELRLTYAPREGTHGLDDWFCDYGFSDQSAVVLDDGFALRGRYVFLRQNGVVQPLDIVEYVPGTKVAEGVEFEQVAVPGLSSLGYFAEESASDDFQFVDQAEIEPRLFTLQIDQSFNIDISEVHLSTITPTLEPLTPHFEVTSDVGNGGVMFFADEYSDDHFVDATDGGDKLLAQRMYLLDPSVTGPMLSGISFSDIDRVGMPTYTAELMVDLHTDEPLPCYFVEENIVDDGFVVDEDPSHIDRALRAVVGGKALRDTMLVTFDPLRPLDVHDLVDETTRVTTWVPNAL